MPPGFSQRGFVSTYAPSPEGAGAGGGGGVVDGGDGWTTAGGGSPPHADATPMTTRREIEERVRMARTCLAHAQDAASFTACRW